MFKKRNLSKKHKGPNSIREFKDDDEHDDQDLKVIDIGNLAAEENVKKQEQLEVPIGNQKLKELTSFSALEAVKEDRLAAELNLKESTEGSNEVDTALDSLSTTHYTGSKGYAKFVKAKQGQKTNINKPGPVKTAANIKATTVVDFQPDICKDFQQHGYCGYGDTCKFLHARDEFKKKVVDKEWEKVVPAKVSKVQGTNGSVRIKRLKNTGKVITQKLI